MEKKVILNQDDYVKFRCSLAYLYRKISMNIDMIGQIKNFSIFLNLEIKKKLQMTGFMDLQHP